jgi:xylulokinase
MNTVGGIDLGTQGCKVIIYDPESRRIVAASSRKLELDAREDGSREQAAADYEAALEACFAGLPAEAKASLAALAVSGQQHGLVALDGEGRVLAPVKIWCDTSTGKECADLVASAGGEESFFEKTGLDLVPGFTASKLLWLKRRRPEVYAKMAHLCLPHDYLNYLLTGRFFAEAGDASGTGLFDCRRRTWSGEIAGLIGPEVFSFLPPLVNPSEPGGTLSPEAARRYGLSEGLLIAPGGGDNMMAAIGTGTVREGVLTMSLGTSGTMFGQAARPLERPRSGLSGFCSSTGAWLPLFCTANCTVASEALRSFLDLDLEAFNTLASNSPPGAEGVVMLPFFNGERVPSIPKGRASLQGLTGANFTRANLARASMESALFGLRYGYEAFVESGRAARELRLVGGGAKSPLWRSIAANVLGLPVVAPAVEEASAFGAALQALYVLRRSGGASVSIEEICDEQLRLDPSTAARPSGSEVRAYETAYRDYRAYLDAYLASGLGS